MPAESLFASVGTILVLIGVVERQPSIIRRANRTALRPTRNASEPSERRGKTKSSFIYAVAMRARFHFCPTIRGR
jgi:hypothetical protein